MSKSNDGCGAFVLMFSLTVLVICMCMEGEASRDNATYEMQVEAVEAGHGTWIVKPDGTTEFKWKEIK